MTLFNALFQVLLIRGPMNGPHNIEYVKNLRAFVDYRLELARVELALC